MRLGRKGRGSFATTERESFASINRAGPGEALKDIDLAVEEGEFFHYGPVRSGKSTLLNIIGCLTGLLLNLYPGGTAGGEAERRAFADIRNRLVGFVFQSFHLCPIWTPRAMWNAFDLPGNRRAAEAEIGPGGPEAVGRQAPSQTFQLSGGAAEGGHRPGPSGEPAVIWRTNLLRPDPRRKVDYGNFSEVEPGGGITVVQVTMKGRLPVTAGASLT